MVTVLPPVAVPEVVTKLVIVGFVTNVYVPAEVAVPPTVVTEILTGPAPWGFVTALMVVGPVTVNDAAVVAPNFTTVAAVNTVPVMVTVLPPVAVPEVVTKLVIVGFVTNAYAPAELTLPQIVVTE